jgi:hypothetical protein
MAVGDIVPVDGEMFEDTLVSASPDLLRTMVREMAQRMMDAEVEQVCGAGYGEVSDQRVNSRNGYRRREWDTRAGTVELAIPKLRSGSYYPEWLLERRRPGGAGAGQRGRDLLPAGGVDSAGGEAGGIARRHEAEQVAGVVDVAGAG